MSQGYETSSWCNGLTKGEVEKLTEWLDYAEKWICYKIQANKGKENAAHWRQELDKITECETWFRKLRSMK